MATSILLTTLVGPVHGAQPSLTLKDQAILDTLVTKALTDSTPTGRQRAATRLLLMGSARHSSSPAAGVVQRAGEIYGRTNDEIIRESIIRLMPLQADTAAAVTFLVAVAREPGHPPHGGVIEFDQAGSGTHAMLAIWGLQTLAAA
jgi:hypothetical protein